jgi:hypothetical protein
MTVFPPVCLVGRLPGAALDRPSCNRLQVAVQRYSYRWSEGMALRNVRRRLKTRVKQGIKRVRISMAEPLRVLFWRDDGSV